MLWHNFKYSLKVLLKNKILLFWTFAFPIILGIFFHMAFSDIESSEKLDVIKIAIINNEEFDRDMFSKEAFKMLSEEEKIFSITYTDIEEAKELLKEEKITGYLLFEEGVNITVNRSGINETVLRYVVDEISSNKEIMTEFYKEGNSQMNISELKGNIKDISKENLSYTMIEYYTLIAMSALYGGILSMFITNYKLANKNAVGKRTSISPAHKGGLLLGSLLASYLVQVVGLSLLFIFTIFCLHVDYGNNLPFMILLGLIGSLAGLSLGVAVATLIKANENTKTGILIAITMLGCFLSGMMGITMKYQIDKTIPLLNKINPANMITDGFYALYYYEGLNRFLMNIISLLAFSLVMLLLSYRGLRRQKYDSI